MFEQAQGTTEGYVDFISQEDCMTLDRQLELENERVVIVTLNQFSKTLKSENHNFANHYIMEINKQGIG